MGFPPSGTGVVHSLATLTPESRRAIERRIFGPVPKDEVAWWNEHRDRLTVTYNKADDFHPSQLEAIDLDTQAFKIPGTIIDLDWREMATLINSRTRPESVARHPEGGLMSMRETTKVRVIEQYLYLICLYANEVRWAEQRRVNAIDKGLRSPDTSAYKYASKDQNRMAMKKKKSKPTRTGYKMISIKDFRKIEFVVEHKDPNLYKIVKEVLNKRNITKENFMNLDFLFIPYIDAATLPGRDGTHYMMAGFGNSSHPYSNVHSSQGRDICL
ncbi:uncharacterized protein PAC_13015 [Phialocephala subalpina]|uniref:Uncharacterized protein n=1 Tax=Phialocephala subalpina TaxID=576137 RepID=A0A1L7XDM9_9HELO|nr:uncharacterized protein PAC_13015 [Phialocephala subalpina]